jgi:hypothetical protein
MDEYAAAKENIFRYQKDGSLLVLNRENEGTFSMAEKAASSEICFFSSKRSLEKGAYMQDGVIYLDGNVKKIYLISDQNRALTLGIDRVIAMNTRTARGSTIFQLKGKGKLVDAGTDFTRFVDAQKYWKTKFPASGVVMAAQDIFSE